MSLEMNLKIRDRGPNEESATEKQKNYIRQMGQIDESVLEKLGKWQASDLIDQMQIIKKSGVVEEAERTRQMALSAESGKTNRKQKKQSAKNKKKRGCLFWFMVIILVWFGWNFLAAILK
jgi:hypothetical protein